jgi:glycosyltransferase involved in cell wall biosynthesis
VSSGSVRLRRGARRMRRAAHVARGTLADHAHVGRLGLAKDGTGPRRPLVIDGCVFENPHTGIARVWRSVLEEWSGSDFAEQVLIVDRGGLVPKHPGFAYMRAPRSVHDLRAERAMLQRVCDRAHADLFISTLYSRPLTTPTLLAVYDLTPEVMGWDLSAPMWRDKAAAIENASFYVCISKSTADDLHRLYPAAADRPTTLIRLGVEEQFHPAGGGEVEAVRDGLGLGVTYYVFVGYRDVHKNAELVFDALSLVDEPRDFSLLMVGGAPELERGFRALAGDTLVRVARLTDDELRAAYSGAAALLFPSRYEGFGLVILEAMACACPVVTCRNSALPEAADSAAIFVDEDSPAEMAEAMRAVLEPDRRAELVSAGLEWSSGFRWSRTAEELARAIADARSAT